MKVVSLFDGISCLRVALGNIDVEYHASEIDKHAIKVSHANYPDIKRLGDVRSVEFIEDVNLLCGGSPCVDLSIAKKDRKGLEGNKSGLFWEYIRILRLLKPKWFILENVASMPKKDKDIITREMGVEPIMIDASLVSAQSRKRLFWTNIPVKGLPEDRKILLKDILQPDAEVDERMTNKEGKAFCLKARYSGATEKHSVATKQSTMVKLKLPLHVPEGKSKEKIRIGREVRRRLTADGTRADADLSITPQRRVETRNDDKCGTITTVIKDNQVVDIEAITIRKLTPIECERLQSLPDDYTKSISTTQRYKTIGNAFNVEVIKFILSFIPPTHTDKTMTISEFFGKTA
jgi:DNA (cytosine-5)-methyltransferase 3A